MLFTFLSSTSSENIDAIAYPRTDSSAVFSPLLPKTIFQKHIFRFWSLNPRFLTARALLKESPLFTFLSPVSSKAIGPITDLRTDSKRVFTPLLPKTKIRGDLERFHNFLITNR